MIGDGVSQLQSIGNQAVNNLVSFLNIGQEDSDMKENSFVENGVYDEMESQKTGYLCTERSSSLLSDQSSDAASLQLGRIFDSFVTYGPKFDPIMMCVIVALFLSS
jgi:hypothetical protein